MAKKVVTEKVILAKEETKTEETKESKTMSKGKATAKSIYEILETGRTTINVNKEAIEIELPPIFGEIPDLDDSVALIDYVHSSPYAHAFAQYAVKWAVRHLRAESKKKTAAKTHEAVAKWEPKLAKKVTRKAEERKAKVEAWKEEGLSAEEIMDRLINEA